MANASTVKTSANTEANTGAKATAKTTNYESYWQAEFNRPTCYPLQQQLSPTHYRPIGEWMGRLILPPRNQREAVMGALLELYHTDDAHKHLVGSTVRLRWSDDQETNSRLWGVTQAVFFDSNARETAIAGNVLPERLDQRAQVNPFESLAGAHPNDDIVVRLQGPVRVEIPDEAEGVPILYTPREPVQISGRFYALVRFVGPIEADSDRYRVIHFNPKSSAFDGEEEIVRLPRVIPSTTGILSSKRADIESSPPNELGWYIYGTQEETGTFCIQAFAPRALLRCQPTEFILGQEASKEYLKPAGWRKVAVKGTIHTALLCPGGKGAEECLGEWREGDALLLVHLYGGIGGPQGEKAARGPLYWGHFAFGTAHVVREPLANELIFDIEYHQVYAHNPDGLSSGTLHWSRYAGDRQFGWLGTRPIQDVLIKLDCFTEDYVIGNLRRSGLTQMALALEVMCARYRIADGRGGTRVSASNNCAQDSSQALYAAFRDIDRALRIRADVKEWSLQHPKDAERMNRLLALGTELRHTLLPFGSARADWEWGMPTIGSSLANNPIDNLGMAVRSWRTILPSIAARSIVNVFLDHGASAWVLRTHQVGGFDPGIEPRIPNV